MMYDPDLQPKPTVGMLNEIMMAIPISHHTSARAAKDSTHQDVGGLSLRCCWVWTVWLMMGSS